MRLFRVLLLALVLLAAGFSTSAQAPWATLNAPPTGLAPSGDVLSAGHLGREIGNVELMIHFYHDLLGLRLMGARSQPRPFGSKHTNPALLEFVQLGQGVPNPMDGPPASRAAFEESTGLLARLQDAGQGSEQVAVDAMKAVIGVAEAQR